MGVRFADFISFFFISHENEIIWSQTILFHFHRIFKNGGGGGGGRGVRANL